MRLRRFATGRGAGFRSTVKIFDLNPNLGFNAPADSSRISSDAKVVSVSPRQNYLTLRVFLTCSSITTSSNQDQQDGRSKQPEESGEGPVSSNDAAGPCCLVSGCFMLELQHLCCFGGK